jgi:hypothetical protein
VIFGTRRQTFVRGGSDLGGLGASHAAALRTRHADRRRRGGAEDDEAFLGVWREWRQGRTREEAEAKAAWMRANRSPSCAGVAQRDLEREVRGEEQIGERERKANLEAPHVVFMSRGQKRTYCNSLILLGTDLYPLRHGNDSGVACEFENSFIFQYCTGD